MKKVLVSLLVIGLLASVSYAAKAPSQNNFRLGALTQSSPAGFGSIITLGTRFNPSMTGDFGFALGQNAAGANSNLGALIRLEFALFKVGDVQTNAGGNLMFSTNPAYAAAPTSSTTLNFFFGVEYELIRNLSILANATVIEITSSAGTTSFGVGAGTALGTGLGAIAVPLYGGLRLYI